MQNEAPIVIGNDGSEFAQAALVKGLWFAQQLGVPARIVRAWTISTAPRPSTWEPGYVPPADDFQAAVRERLAADTAEARAHYPDVDVTLDCPHGAAGRELLKASETARLLVVGRRGAGGFQGLLLGSVTDQVVAHALCDVLVVRRDGDPAPARSAPLDGLLD